MPGNDGNGTDRCFQVLAAGMQAASISFDSADCFGGVSMFKDRAVGAQEQDDVSFSRRSEIIIRL